MTIDKHIHDLRITTTVTNRPVTWPSTCAVWRATPACDTIIPVNCWPSFCITGCCYSLTHVYLRHWTLGGWRYYGLSAAVFSTPRIILTRLARTPDPVLTGVIAWSDAGWCPRGSMFCWLHSICRYDVWRALLLPAWYGNMTWRHLPRGRYLTMTIVVCLLLMIMHSGYNVSHSYSSAVSPQVNTRTDPVLAFSVLY